MFLVLSGLLTMQSCTKVDNTTFTTFKAAVPANPTPAVDAVVPFSGTTYNLNWEGTTTTTWDVYAGTKEKPGLAKAGVTGNTYAFNTTEGGDYYWYVVTKDENGMASTSPTWHFFINNAPTVPKLKTPAANAVDFSVVGALTWSVTDPEGDPMTYDVYLGTTNNPALIKSDVADSTYSPAMLPATTYYWKVVAKDNHGASSTSAVGSFTTGAKSLDPLSVFTGSYLADEPAESYTYDVAFTLGTASSVTTDNYWNSAWVAVFTIDLTNLTYTMPTTTWSSGYSGTESGIVDPKTGTMTGTYTIWHNGTITEQGVHTYTKK